MDRATAEKLMKEYHFLVSMDLGEGLKISGNPVGKHKRKILDIIDSMDLTGKRVLDVGCANGLFSLEVERRGSSEILAVDNSINNIECLKNLIIPRMNSKMIQPCYLNVLDLNSRDHGTFDLVICAGLLYHMRYPFWFLRTISSLLQEGGKLILETAMLEDFNIRPLLFYPTGKDSPYTNASLSCTFFNEKALTETLERFGLKVQSRYVSTKPLRRFLKKTAGFAWPAYCPASRIVLQCTKDSALENEKEFQIFDATM